MAWRCSGSSNKELVSLLAHAKLITQPTVENAMLIVDRGKYSRFQPYEVSHGPLACRKVESSRRWSYAIIFGKSRCHRMLHKLSDMERPSLRPTCTLLLWKPCRLSCFPEPKVKYRRHDLCLLHTLLKQNMSLFFV